MTSNRVRQIHRSRGYGAGADHAEEMMAEEASGVTPRDPNNWKYWLGLIGYVALCIAIIVGAFRLEQCT